MLDKSDRDKFGMNRRGEFYARAARYALTLAAGYLVGLFATASFDGQTLPWYVAAFFGILALVLVFKRGVKSQQHVAMDLAFRAQQQFHLQHQTVVTQQVGSGNSAAAVPVATGQQGLTDELVDTDELVRRRHLGFRAIDGSFYREVVAIERPGRPPEHELVGRELTFGELPPRAVVL